MKIRKTKKLDKLFIKQAKKIIEKYKSNLDKANFKKELYRLLTKFGNIYKLKPNLYKYWNIDIKVNKINAIIDQTNEQELEDYLEYDLFNFEYMFNFEYNTTYYGDWLLD